MANVLQQRYDPYSDEPNPSLLRRLGSTALSGLSRVAAGFDLPGSMLRDVLGGENPFDNLLHPFSFENRLSGRDLLRKHGAVGPDDSWANFGAGLAVDIGTDPFTYLGPGGLLKAAASGVKGLGTAGKVAKAAQAGEGLLKFQVPGFKSTERQLLTGSSFITGADKLHKAAETVGTSYPVRSARTMLASSVMARNTPEGQRIGREIFERQGHGGQQVRELTTDIARSLETSGRATPAGATALRREIETGIPHGTAVSSEAQKLADMYSTYRTKSEWIGLPFEKLDDDIGYAMRQLNENLVEQGSKSTGPLAARASSDTARLQLLKGFTEGTEGVNKLFADQGLKGKVTNWSQQIETARKGGATPQQLKVLQKQAAQDIEQHITQHHGSTITQTYQPVSSSGKKLWELNGKNVWSRTQPQGANVVTRDRYKGLAKFAMEPDRGKWFDQVPFPNNPVVDAEQYALSHENRIRAGQTIYEHVARLAKPGAQMDLKTSTSVGQLIKGLGFKSKTASQRIADILGTNWTKQSGKDILGMRIDKSLADDLMASWPSYQVPKNTGLLLNSLDSMQSLWKAGVLTWPATIVRNATSGAVQNILKGWLDLSSFIDAHRLAQGQTIKNLTGIKEIRDWLSARSLPVTDDHATEALRQLFGSYSTGHLGTDVTSATMPNVDPGIQSLLARVPGRFPSTAAESAKKMGRTIIGREPGTNLNPLNVRGVGGRTTSTFGPAAAADMSNEYVDVLNRAGPLIYRLRQGHSAENAMREITAAQVDYSSRAFTREEKTFLKRAFPFYSFTKSQLHWVANELLNHPGGRLRNVIRATAAARGDDPGVPDYLSDTASIPLGTLEDGSRRFITGFGFMHEDPLSFAGGPRDSMLEAASRANPLIKAPLEYMTGQSFFQRGSDGGRPIEDLDPTLGRIASNLTGGDKPLTFPGSPLIEQIAANSPASRLLTAARTLTDPRKDVLTKGTNLLSGIRIADVSEAAHDRAMLERSASVLKELGGRTYSESYLPKDRLENLSGANRDLAEKLKELRGILDQRRKGRRQIAAAAQ